MRLRVVYNVGLSIVMDLVAALGALGLAAVIRYPGRGLAVLSGSVPVPELALVSWLSIWLLCLWVAGLYDRNAVLPLRDQIAKLVWAAVLHALLILALMTATEVHGVSRLLIGLAFVLQAGLAAVGRAAANRLLAAFLGSERARVRALLVGDHAEAEAMAALFRQHPELGVGVVGRVEPPSTPEWAKQSRNGHVQRADSASIPLLGGAGEFPEILRRTVVDEVFLAPGNALQVRLTEFRQPALEQGKTVHVLIPQAQGALAHPRLTRIGNQVFLSYVFGPQDSPFLLVKRLVDVVAAVVLLVLTAPLMVAIALAIKLTSPGPVLFRQKRVGLHGRVFTIYKFRTMVDGAEAMRDRLVASNQMSGPVFKLQDDPRVTPLGRILRRLSLDELPQLWNVLRGDMSLVGPRPLPVVEVEALEHAAQGRHAVRPGLSGLWQVSGRSRLRSTDALVAKDMEYIAGWTLGKDLSILIRTVPELLRGGGW